MEGVSASASGSSAQTEKASEVVRAFQRLQGSRGNWENQWQEIAQRVIPGDVNFFSAFGQTSAKGQKKTEFIFDSTASLALNRFAAILDSLLTPAASTWMSLTTDDQVLKKNRATQLWFEDANRILFKYRYAPRANFQAQNQRNFISLGAYGTGCTFTDPLDGPVRGLRYRNTHLGEVYIQENHQGIVDYVLRHFPLTARQAYQKWGDKLPETIKSKCKLAPEAEFYFLHEVKPRADVDPRRKDFKGMAFESTYVAVEGQALLSEGGYRTFPYAVSRYEQSPGEVYGRSPAMLVLPAIKTLNEEKKTILKAGHRAVDPVLLAHDDGVVDGFSLKPGAINGGGVTADGRPLIHALPTGNLQIGKELMDDERQVINDAFLVSLFQILMETPQMTATEVLERAREKGILIAPTIGRQNSEYLGPLVERELDVLQEQKLLPPMPPMLVQAQGEYKIRFESPLAKAQRAEEGAGVSRLVESMIQVVTATQNPAPMDFLDWDIMVPELADINGVPKRWIRDLATVQHIRAGRAQEQQQQAAVQAAPAAAAMMKAQAVNQKLRQG